MRHRFNLSSTFFLFVKFSEAKNKCLKTMSGHLRCIDVLIVGECGTVRCGTGYV